jgi:hypothetical protein
MDALTRLQPLGFGFERPPYQGRNAGRPSTTLLERYGAGPIRIIALDATDWR